MTSKEALETLVYGLTNNQYAKEDLGITMSKCREIITKDLEDFEWLKSKLNLTFLDTLSNPDDKAKVLEIMGIEYGNEN